MKDAQNDIDLLSAFLDGGLDSHGVASVKSRLARDAEFAALLTALKRSDQHLRRAIHSIDAVPLHDNLLKLLSEPQKPAQNGIFVSLVEFFGSLVSVGAYKAVPAAAAIALVAGFFFLQNASIEPQSSAPEMASSPQVDLSPLNDLVAGENAAVTGGTLTQILAFRRHDGALCKHYIYEGSASDASLAGVACLSGDAWAQVAFGKPAEVSKTSTYRMASGESQAEVDTYIQANMTGSVLTVEEERAVLRTRKTQ